MCVFMYVGEFDEYMWHGEMKREAEFLRSKGTVARYSVEKGQPHRLETLAGANAARLFDGFEERQKKAAATSGFGLVAHDEVEMINVSRLPNP